MMAALAFFEHDERVKTAQQPNSTAMNRDMRDENFCGEWFMGFSFRLV